MGPAGLHVTVGKCHHQTWIGNVPWSLLAESPFWDLGVAIPWGFREFSSLTRDQTLALGSERRVLTNRLPGNSHSWVTLRKFFHKLKPPFLHL